MMEIVVRPLMKAFAPYAFALSSGVFAKDVLEVSQNWCLVVGALVFFMSASVFWEREEHGAQS